MLSIIICSRHTYLSKDLTENLNSTIGIEYEIIIVDNSSNRYSIFEAYNLGVSRAIYPYLCFMHEDILFHTNNWGKKVIEHFNNPEVGIIGVAGSHYVPKLPGAHWSSGITSANIIHTINQNPTIESFRFLNNEESSVKGVILDGLWLCIPETIIKKVFFDEITFTGFHCYDSDICLQIRKLNFTVNIVFDIDIEHFSLGKRDISWLKDIFTFYNKWEKELPLSSVKLSKKQISQANFSNAKELIEQIQINKFGLLYIYKTWIYYLKSNPPTSNGNLMLLIRLINERFYFSLKKKIKKRI